MPSFEGNSFIQGHEILSQSTRVSGQPTVRSSWF